MRLRIPDYSGRVRKENESAPVGSERERKPGQVCKVCTIPLKALLGFHRKQINNNNNKSTFVVVVHRLLGGFAVSRRIDGFKSSNLTYLTARERASRLRVSNDGHPHHHQCDTVSVPSVSQITNQQTQANFQLVS